MSGAASAWIRRGAPQGCVPFERYLLAPAAFGDLRDALRTEQSLALLSFWAEPGFVHAAFLDEVENTLLLATTPVQDGRYPALSPARPGHHPAPLPPSPPPSSLSSSSGSPQPKFRPLAD